jgi:cysteinyl-tRNA synthetase
LSIFKEFTTCWEQDYNTDMAHLNVLPPTRIIRVSDVVPEIVAFVEKIIESACAYPTSDGDVYFDVAQFQANGHRYAKLKPSNAGDTERLLAEAEGSLTVGAGKRTNVDFALWKSSKAGEPRWPSPWGEVTPPLPNTQTQISGQELMFCLVGPARMAY